MRTLLDEEYAPCTSAIGFLHAGLDVCRTAMTAWRGSLHGDRLVTARTVSLGFPTCLAALEPLTGGARPRELFVETSGEWTAYFDCSIRGPDAVSAVGHLSQAIGCDGLAVRAVPHMPAPDRSNGRFGAVQFEMFAPYKTEFLNYLRTVSVTHDGRRWRFDAWGDEQPFEESATYAARRVRDRFTSEMLERYCEAVGVSVFEPESYGPDAVVVETQVTLPQNGLVMSLRQAQAWLGIVPGMAVTVPG
jgi:hypothetical protein